MTAKKRPRIALLVLYHRNPLVTGLKAGIADSASMSKCHNEYHIAWPFMSLVPYFSIRLCISRWLNILGPRQNGRRFADDIFKCIFVTENVWITIQISLKFAPNGPINNIPVLVQIMAWRREDDKPLSEPTMARLPTHTCVTRPQWVNVGCGIALEIL